MSDSILAVVGILLLLVFVFIVLVAVGRQIERNSKGRDLLASFTLGDFENDSVPKIFDEWFAAQPARAEQRSMFVKLALGMGCSQERVGYMIMSSVMEVWKNEGASFGDSLATRLDNLVVWESPTSEEQAQMQIEAKEAIARYGQELKALD